MHYFSIFQGTVQHGIRVHESPDTHVNKGKNSNFFKDLDKARPIPAPIQGGGGGGGASIIFRVSNLRNYQIKKANLRLMMAP